MSQQGWENTIVYQVYPKSFKDSNEDGIGDIKGLISSLDYIKELGVNTIWINPIFISPQIDNGYDISNYYAIDEIFGDLQDVEEFIKEAHKRELKILLDLVLNHTSSQHPWFKEALKGPQNIYRDYYLWHDEIKKGVLPNNWASFFGGSVWEKESLEGQYYFHLFDKKMPDLNWRNPEVKRAMVEIAKFWLEKGIDGFRLDAFIHIIKDDFSKMVPNVPKGEIELAEIYYANLPEVKFCLSEFLSEVKEIKPDIFILGEAASATPKLAKSYIREDLCDVIISFDHFVDKVVVENELIPKNLTETTMDTKKMKHKLKEWQETLVGKKYPTLYWNNHDMTRVISRFGDEEIYRDKSAKALATAMYLLRGIPVILYGEELGMRNLKINHVSTFQNPEVKNQYITLLENGFTKEKSLKLITAQNKEASRGVMQWDDSQFSGFSTTKSWIGENVETDYNVEAETKNPGSVLNFYKELLKLKKTNLFTQGSVTFLETSDNLLAYKRELKKEEALILVNLTKEKVKAPAWLDEYKEWQSIFNSETTTNQAELAPYAYQVLKRKG